MFCSIWSDVYLLSILEEVLKFTVIFELGQQFVSSLLVLKVPGEDGGGD